MSRKAVDGRKGSSRNNFGQENRGSKSPFKGPSPMETQAPGERMGNVPRGPSIRDGSQNQGGGGKPSESLDKASREDVSKHGGRK